MTTSDAASAEHPKQSDGADRSAMNLNEPSPERRQASSAGRRADDLPAPARSPRELPFTPKWRRRLLLALGLFFVVSSMYQLMALDQVQRELARRVQDSDAMSHEAKIFAKEASHSVRDIQDRIAQMEERIANSQNQQLALEQLYRDLAQNRDDWVLAEVEQTIQSASQQLQLSGNVSGALAALQTADNRLARTERPHYLPLRKALAEDMDRLKALPAVDMAGMAVKIDALISAVDKLPLLADDEGSTETASRAENTPALNDAPLPDRSDENPWDRTVNGWKDRWDRFWDRLWQQLSQLIRVHEVSQPDALLLTPSQAYFVRENLKLRLLNARLALMSRNETAFRTDLSLTKEWLMRYFDVRTPSVQQTHAQLNTLANASLSISMPTLAESLALVRKLSDNANLQSGKK